MRLNACPSEDVWGAEMVEAMQDSIVAHLCVDQTVNARRSSEQMEYEGGQIAPFDLPN